MKAVSVDRKILVGCGTGRCEGFRWLIYHSTMSSTLSILLAEGPRSALGAQWIVPDLVLLDDRSAPMVLQAFFEAFGPAGCVRFPERVSAISTIDPDDALPHQQRGHDLLRAFAEHHQLSFVHAQQLCRETRCIPSSIDLPPGGIIIQAIPPRGESFSHGAICADDKGTEPETATCGFSAQIAATGSISLALTPTDIAFALSVGRFWLRRPPVHFLELVGSFANPEATIHDLAIQIRSLSRGLQDDCWLVLRFGDSPPLRSRMIRERLAALLRDLPMPFTLSEECDEEPVASIHLSTVEPMIEVEGRPVRAESFQEVPERVYIGSCTPGCLDDHRMAAAAISDQRVRVPTFISTATQVDHESLRSERIDPEDPSSPSLAATFEQAGCDTSLLPGCGGCVTAIADLLAAVTNGPQDRDPSAPPASTNPVYFMTSPTTIRSHASPDRKPRLALGSPLTAVRIATGTHHAAGPLRAGP